MPSTTQPLVFPIKGLHESVGFDIQPPGTTNDAFNVRAFCALAGRARGGRRSGTTKYTYQKVTTLGKPVQNMVKAVEGSEYSPPFVTLVEDFQSYTAEVGPDLSPLWGMASILDEDTPTLSIYPAVWETIGTGLAWQQSSDTEGGQFLSHLVPLMSDAEDSVTVTLRAKPDITSGNAGFGGVDEPTGVGPFIKASPDLQNGYFANLTVSNSTSNIVSLNIYRMDPSGSQGYVRVTNQNITLDGGSTVTTDCKISLWVSEEDGTSVTIKARLQWVGGGVGATNIDETIESTRTNTDTGTNQTFGQNGSGFGIFNPGVAISNNPTFTTGTAFRIINQVDARYRTPPTRPVVVSWAATEAGANRYHRPTGLTTIVRGAGDTYDVATSDGYDSASTDSGEVFVDTTVSQFVSGINILPSTDESGVCLIRPWDSNGPFDAEVVMQVPSGMGTTDDARLDFYLRVDDVNNYAINLGLVFGIDHADSANNGTGLITAITIDAVSSAGISAFNGTDLVPIPFISGSTLRVEDAGTSIDLYLDGRLISSFALPLINLGTPGPAAPSDAQDTYLGITQGFSVADAGPFPTYVNYVSEIRWVRRTGSKFNAAGSTSSGRLLAVSGGDIVDVTSGLVSSIATGTEALTDAEFSIQSVSAFNSVFFTDGEVIKEYKLSTGAVGVPTATTGSFPALPRLVTLYRGRLVWSGTSADPHNWFMSAVGNPFDYNYSPATPNETQAVAGNNSTAGLIGDVINAIIPFGDDYMIFGCDHSVWQMSGDPAAGGVIDLVSDQTGMAFGSAWAKDPSNTLYFWGNDGVYRLVVGDTPQNMTKNRIDFRLRTVALDENRIFMAWNYLDAELVILIQPSDPSADVRIIVWESRTDAWWEDVYPTTHGPNSVLMYDSTAANDQALLLGGRDGFIRKVDEGANDDDGTAIASRIRFAPFIAPSRLATVILNMISPVLANGSSTVKINVYTGQTAEGCMTATSPRASVALSHAGRNRMIRRNIRGYAVQVEIEQAAGTFPWALESMVAVFEQSGLPIRHARVSGEGATGGS